MLRLLILSVAASFNLLVPEQFKRNPDSVVPVLFLSPSEVNRVCNVNKDPVTFYACETSNGLIIMPNPCDYPEYKDPYSYARLMCHEKAHVNGWVHP